jgi:hypothetical protein
MRRSGIDLCVDRSTDHLSGGLKSSGAGGINPAGRQNANGYYISGDYQFARRWFAGARYDRSARSDDGSLRDTGQAFVLTYWPSEFGQVRGQYRRLRYAEDETANEFLFQFQFSIGAHGAHPF